MRRRLITHPRFQFSFTFAYVQGIFLALTIPAVALFFAFYYVAKDPIVTVPQRAVLIQTLNSAVSVFLGLLGGAALIFAAVGLYRSYKFIGPLRRVEEWASKHLRTGEMGEIKLRDGDEILSVIHVLYRVIGKMF